MKTVTLFEYGDPKVAPFVHAVFANDRCAADLRDRKRWIFEIRDDGPGPGLPVRLRSVTWETRATARHKWVGIRAWHWSSNDIPNRRVLPQDYIVTKRPEIHPRVVAEALQLVRESIRFESESP